MSGHPFIQQPLDRHLPAITRHTLSAPGTVCLFGRRMRRPASTVRCVWAVMAGGRGVLDRGRARGPQAGVGRGEGGEGSLCPGPAFARAHGNTRPKGQFQKTALALGTALSTVRCFPFCLIHSLKHWLRPMVVFAAVFFAGQAPVPERCGLEDKWEPSQGKVGGTRWGGAVVSLARSALPWSSHQETAVAAARLGGRGA